MACHERACGLDTAYPGHLEVHEHHVDPVGLDDLQRLLARRRLADDLEVIERRAVPGAVADHGMVVDETRRSRAHDATPEMLNGSSACTTATTVVGRSGVPGPAELGDAFTHG